MPLRTRRRLLYGTAALLTGLAGCSRSTWSDGSNDGRRRGENVEDDPEWFALRNPDDRSPVWFPRERDGETTASATTGPPERARTQGLVASADTAERLQFADLDEAERARQFATDTDFETETLYVESRSVDECRSPVLCHVSWSATEVDTQYGGRYRGTDVSCRKDASDAVTWLIRIPDVLDPDQVSGYGSGWSSSGCRGRQPSREETRTTTEPPDLGPATNATETEDDR